MSCFCCCHGNTDGFMITHLSKKDHIRCLPQGSTQSGNITVRIRCNLTLGNHAFFMPVKILNRIFQRDHMGIAGFIDLINNTGKSGAFTAACRPCYKNHSPGKF